MYLEQRPAYLSAQRAWADNCGNPVLSTQNKGSPRLAGRGKDAQGASFSPSRSASLIPTLETGRFGQGRWLSKCPLAKVISKSFPSPNPIYPRVRHSRLIR